MIATLTLAGCASNPSKQYAEDGAHMVRDVFLARTKSDPLGAYLASREFEHYSQDYSSDPYSSDAYSRPALGAPALASTALGMLGIKYKFGGESPSTGFDCSGLVAYAAEKSLGLKLPRKSSQLAREGTSVKQSELRKGDLVFFNTLGARFSHVGIYLGNHKFVHAPRSGAKVRVEDMNISYWKKRYNGARRLAAAPSEVASN